MIPVVRLAFQNHVYAVHDVLSHENGKHLTHSCTSHWISPIQNR